MKPNLPTLLPCPFCGGVPEYWKVKVVRCVRCMSCGITTIYTTWEEAAEIWNTRIPRWPNPMANYTKRFNQKQTEAEHFEDWLQQCTEDISNKKFDGS